MLKCHNRKIITQVNRVITSEGKKYNYCNEYLISGYCGVCSLLIVVHLFETHNDKKLKRTYKGKKAIRFLSKVIQESKMYKSQQVDYRSYLNYNEYGSIKKCYSNLSNIKLGKEDTYQGLSKNNNVA